MNSRDRRIGLRVPLEIFITQYINDRPYRALTTDISDTGLRVDTVVTAERHLNRAKEAFGLEIELPGTGEIIWARGRVCHSRSSGATMGAGIRFTGMPRVHQKLLRDYCIEARHAHLDALLQNIYNPRANA